jgi:hypothetical protein
VPTASYRTRMQEGVSLMYSWDPRVRRWVSERAQQVNTPAPPAAPIDIDAVQTYYFDAESGLWTVTILGDTGRRIAAELGDRYRGAAVVGLALEQQPLPTRRDLVPTPDQVRRIPRLAWLIGILAAIGVAVYATTAPLPPTPPLPLP